MFYVMYLFVLVHIFLQKYENNAGKSEERP